MLSKRLLPTNVVDVCLVVYVPAEYDPAHPWWQYTTNRLEMANCYDLEWALTPLTLQSKLELSCFGFAIMANFKFFLYNRSRKAMVYLIVARMDTILHV